MPATVIIEVDVFLCKMTSNDKDFRFMAINDLMAELQKDSIKLDDDSERKVLYTVCWNAFLIIINALGDESSLKGGKHVIETIGR